MGTQTLLELVEDALHEIGVQPPSAVASGSDEDSKRLLRIANREGLFLSTGGRPSHGIRGVEYVGEHAWQVLKTEGTITLVDGTQGYARATDFRYLLPSTVWDDTADRFTIGPLSPQEWQRTQVSGTVFGLNWRWEMRNNQFVFDQPIGSAEAGTSIVYEYLSKNWAESTGGTDQAKFLADTDTQKLDDATFSQGIKWRYLKSLGFPEWIEEFQAYKTLVGLELSRDAGSRPIRMGASRQVLGLNTPETNFGS